MSQITLSKPWASGLVMPTSCISELLLRPGNPCHCSLLETLVGASRCSPLVSVAGLALRILRRQVTTLRVCVFLLFLFGKGFFFWEGLESSGAWSCLELFEVPCHPVRGPLLSPSTLESHLAWVVPACRVAIDTSLLCLKCSGPPPYL